MVRRPESDSGEELLSLEVVVGPTLVTNSPAIIPRASPRRAAAEPARFGNGHWSFWRRLLDL